MSNKQFVVFLTVPEELCFLSLSLSLSEWHQMCLHRLPHLIIYTHISSSFSQLIHHFIRKYNIEICLSEYVYFL